MGSPVGCQGKGFGAGCGFRNTDSVAIGVRDWLAGGGGHRRFLTYFNAIDSIRMLFSGSDGYEELGDAKSSRRKRSFPWSGLGGLSLCAKTLFPENVNLHNKQTGWLFSNYVCGTKLSVRMESEFVDLPNRHK